MTGILGNPGLLVDSKATGVWQNHSENVRHLYLYFSGLLGRPDFIRSWQWQVYHWHKQQIDLSFLWVSPYLECCWQAALVRATPAEGAGQGLPTKGMSEPSQ